MHRQQLVWESDFIDDQTLTQRTISAARSTLTGRLSIAGIAALTGPSIVASVAYVDPGNLATNIQAGSKLGYQLLWVVVLANLVAMLFQGMSAKLGIVTGRNLAELCRDHLPRWLVYAMWVLCEGAAMATDLAELLGASVGLQLLLHLPLLVSMLLAATASYCLLLLQYLGFRPLERVIAALVALIALSFFVELVVVPPDWHAVLYHSVVPTLGGSTGIMLAVAIFGSTVMPHAILLHSSLTQSRIPTCDDREKRLMVRYSNVEVLVTLGIAGLANMAMVIVATLAFHNTGHTDLDQIETAYKMLTPLLDGHAALLFMVALLASGLSSTVVGTMAGQVVMQGFVGFGIPLWLRRLVTMLPAFVVIMAGANVTNALVVSQIVLSMILPVPLIALILLMRRRDIMGVFRSSRFVTGLAAIITAMVIVLNILVLLQSLGIRLLRSA